MRETTRNWGRLPSPPPVQPPPLVDTTQPAWDAPDLPSDDPHEHLYGYDEDEVLRQGFVNAWRAEWSQYQSTLRDHAVQVELAPEVAGMTVPGLRAGCRYYGLKISGVREEFEGRISDERARRQGD